MNSALYFVTNLVFINDRQSVIFFQKSLFVALFVLVIAFFPNFPEESYFSTLPSVDNNDIFTKFHLTYNLYFSSQDIQFKPAVVKQYIKQHAVMKQNKRIGMASIYSDSFDGKTMANGRTFHIDRDTVASLVFPIGTKLKITNLRNHAYVYAINTDKMAPEMLRKGRIVDLSPHLASLLGFRDGLAKVSVEAILLKDRISYKSLKGNNNVRKYNV